MHEDYFLVLGLEVFLGIWLGEMADAQEEGVVICLKFTDPLDHSRLLVIVVYA